jgi:8-oxo-dGTP pyrophosphatase MutT (NUDIX family)/mannose-6-phosphate isomerase-like protein (cupin superfamily)
MTGAAMPVERTAGGVVLGPHGRIALVSQQGMSWSLPKGHMEPGETAEATAIREVGEETGLSQFSCRGRLVRYGRSAINGSGKIEPDRLKQVELFLFETAESELLPADPENPEARWIDPTAATDLLSHPVDAAVLSRLLPRIEVLRAGRARSALASGLSNEVHQVLPGCPAEMIERLAHCLEVGLAGIAAEAEVSFDKPYGENHVLSISGDYGLSCAALDPGTSTSLHFHRHRRELFLVRTGTLTFVKGSETIELGVGRRGESVPGELHAIANRGPGRVEVAELFSPPLLDDKVRVSDAYGRGLGAVTRFK